jgi:hypothetical protein
VRNIGTLALVAIVLAPSVASADLAAPLPPSSPAVEHVAPSPTTVIEPEGEVQDPHDPAATSTARTDPDLEAVIAWATQRFQLAGLTMPDTSIHRHDDRSGCDDHVGLFIGTDPTPEVHLCFRR